MITGGRLPNEYNAEGQYIGDGAADGHGHGDNSWNSRDDDDGGKRGRSETRAGCDIDLEKVLQRETRDRDKDHRISAKLIRFVAKMCEYQYEDRYDVFRAVLIARKNWSNMKPRKHQTAFF